MHKLEVTLETVTPLFLGGAEPRGQPELRPPAFRGAMRYWLRAALGGVIGDKNINGLQRLESIVFGNTDYSSGIVLRLGQKEIPHLVTPILPHKPKSGSRQAIEANQQFILTISARRWLTPEVWNITLASLALTVAFGGIGLRSRRGYGTLRIVSATDHSELITPTDVAKWKGYIEQIAVQAIQAADQFAQTYEVPVAGLPPGPADFPCATRLGLIRLGEPVYNSAIEAIREFMQKVPKLQYLGGIGPRQGSPLWVRPVQMGNRSYSLLFIVLASRLKVGTNYKAVKQFLETFKGENLSVKGWNT